jgi:hypothetical protein
MALEDYKMTKVCAWCPAALEQRVAALVPKHMAETVY